MTIDAEKQATLDQREPSVAASFVHRVQQSGPKVAYQFPIGDTDEWTSITWDQTKEQVDELAAGLLALGVKFEERVAIAAATRIEWVLADLAVMCAGCATTTVYPTTMSSDVAHILADSESRVVFVEDADQLAKLVETKGDIPSVVKVVAMTGDPTEFEGYDPDWVISWDQLRELGREKLAETPDVVSSVIERIGPDHLATLIYTSGTTGKPKGVRLSQGAWTYEGAAIKAEGFLFEDDVQFLWLPMAHSFGKVLLVLQFECGFVTAVDGRVEKIIDNLAIVKPTFMGAAPRIFEKAYARIVTMQAAEGGLKEKLFNKAFEVGLKVDALEREGASIPLPLKLQHGLFDKLVFSKVRERFGGRVRFFISGSAALNREIAEWFNAAGIQILEGFGLTETSAGTFVNRPGDNRFGTVGPPVLGTQVKLGDNDEVLVKGPGVMQGYHNLPDETAAALDEDGWLHTGDKGSLDADNYLTITGRIKELFKTSGGKYIVPPAIEAKFKVLCPYASQFMVFGDKRNYCVALVTLDPEAIAEWAESHGLSGKTYTEIVKAPQTVEMVQEYVDKLNLELNRWETIKKFTLLDHDLSVESGELTPSMKVKRGVVQGNHAELIAAMYE